jgi:hypothetical protein
MKATVEDRPNLFLNRSCIYLRQSARAPGIYSLQDLRPKALGAPALALVPLSPSLEGHGQMRKWHEY